MIALSIELKHATLAEHTFTMNTEIKRTIVIPNASTLGEGDYREFLTLSYGLLGRFRQYLTTDEDINSLELAHLVPDVPESLIAIYLGINDAVCNKGLVSPFLIRHGHHNVYAFDPEVWGGGAAVPDGTLEARSVLNDFQPPNETWPDSWTYVMVSDPALTHEDMWQTRGYIDTVPAKFEDFTMLSDPEVSPLCAFVDEKVFEHPVNQARSYLKGARDRGQRQASAFGVPKGLEGETRGLVPVVLKQGEKLFIARTDFKAAEHCWSNLHPDTQELAVINENSAVPLNLILKKPLVRERFAGGLEPVFGSADMTTDWFLRRQRVCRKAILQGTFKG
jgi:hypothetical protein